MMLFSLLILTGAEIFVVVDDVVFLADIDRWADILLFFFLSIWSIPTVGEIFFCYCHRC